MIIFSFMETKITIQGRILRPDAIDQIKKLMIDHPQWHRTRLSKELCLIWNWRNHKGHIKDMACRTLLLKLEKQGKISLPALKRPAVKRCANHKFKNVPHSKEIINCSLKHLIPLNVSLIDHTSSKESDLYSFLLAQYHYLGFQNTVGENMKYLLHDKHGRTLACLLFGSAAWKCAPRDQFIGWNEQSRMKKLYLITNNTRFLILPWIKVANLASHILSVIIKRINQDWLTKYGHPLYVLETFVDSQRFLGTSYKGANWIEVGQSKGRTRNDRHHTMKVAVKNILLYPLSSDFRRKLNETA